MVEALKTGGSVVGAAPYTDTNPRGQIDRVFEMARRFDIDIDMHLDFGPDPNDLDLEYVCRLTDTYRYGGRVAIGHVTKLSAAPAERFEEAAKRLADAGVALTVLPGDGPLPDGAAHAPQCDAGCNPYSHAAAHRGQLLALHQQRPEPVHAVR